MRLIVNNIYRVIIIEPSDMIPNVQFPKIRETQYTVKSLVEFFSLLSQTFRDSDSENYTQF